jgi:hypothetical protein
VENLQRMFVAGDVELVARAAFKGATPVGTNLRADSEDSEEAECAPRHRGIGHVQMDGHLTASFEVDASCRMEEPRQLGESIALAARRNRCELVPEVLRQ